MRNRRKRNFILLGSTVCLAFLCTASVAHEISPEEAKCLIGRAKAQARYQACVLRVVAKFYKRISFEGISFYKCTDTYVETWPELQQLTGSTCDAPRFVDNLDGTVSDNLTGLIWQKTDDLGGETDRDNAYAWTDGGDGDATDEDGTAFTTFLEHLNAGAGFAGANGWRLPTFAELLTILDPDCTTSPCIDEVFGPISTTPVSVYYWSSTTDGSMPTAAWIANFAGGIAYLGGKESSFHVRAVRRGS